jgi:hypothetical protein
LGKSISNASSSSRNFFCVFDPAQRLDARRHKFRMQTKGLRYATEFCATLLMTKRALKHANNSFQPLPLCTYKMVERHKSFIFSSHGSRSVKERQCIGCGALNVKLFAAFVVLSLLQLLHLIFSLPRETTSLDSITGSDDKFNE